MTNLISKETLNIFQFLIQIEDKIIDMFENSNTILCKTKLRIINEDLINFDLYDDYYFVFHGNIKTILNYSFYIDDFFNNTDKYLLFIEFLHDKMDNDFDNALMKFGIYYPNNNELIDLRNLSIHDIEKLNYIDKFLIIKQ